MNPRKIFIFLSIIVPIAIGLLYTKWPSIIWSFVLLIPLIILGYYDLLQTKKSIKRNYPILGNIRYLLENIRPEIMQYFVETDTEGRPINRLLRSLVYQRAKGQIDTTAFGTQENLYDIGYEWMNHSIYAKNMNDLDHDPRVKVGGKDCKKPYSASLLNISAMSYGSLSKNAVLAMNKGAKLGNFAQNTGEGGVSEFHTEHGGDLIWQIGTGYFGCRTDEGGFCPEKYAENATKESVKMIELKLSQGAKPGRGGMLPATKNTIEIAKIRGVEPHTKVYSPSSHKAFNSPKGLLKFIKQLRDLSGGKPVGFKLCIGNKDEFIEICKMMIETDIKPDFIAIDGGEGGTGAAPIEFSNSIGMPLRDGLAFVIDTLRGYDLKKDIKVIAAGKIISSFDMMRVIALGADIIYSARAMMLATGCIQALQCNTNTCPVGIATQNKNLMKGLVVENKATRVANYHKATMKSFIELMAAGGIYTAKDLNRKHINRRMSMNRISNYSEIFPDVEVGIYT